MKRLFAFFALLAVKSSFLTAKTAKGAKGPIPFVHVINTPMRTLSLFIFLLLFGINSTAQELVGPDRTPSGTLSAFEIIPAQEASWYVVSPSSNTESYQVDTKLSKLYFASPVSGCYTVIAGIVIDGKPELLVKTFHNGTDDTPIPPASSWETWINTQMPMLVKSASLVSEARLVAECFEQIVQRIETENIRTVQNAQAQLQITLTGTLALASPTAVTEWTPFLAELSQRLEQELGNNIDDLSEVKRIFQTIGNALQTYELPNSPNNRGQGTQNRVFRNLLAR